MIAATSPRDSPLEERVLVVHRQTSSFDDARVRDLPKLLRPGDVLVVNDAATFPASLSARTAEGRLLEVRLAGRSPSGAFRAVLFGEGDWRTRTEDRPAPPRVAEGEELAVVGLRAKVVEVSALSPRLVSLRFEADDDEVWRAIYARGRYVQYAYMAATVFPWQVQTPYAGPPWASEMPSAGRPLVWEVLRGLGERGVDLARVTHAAGLSSTGDPRLDAALPLPERWRVPVETAEAVRAAKARGGRVVAVGTTVVRALESAVDARGELHAGEGETSLLIGPGYAPKIVDGLFTGMHERGASHFALLHAFAPAALLERAYAHASRAGYLCHEFGDSSLILRKG